MHGTAGHKVIFMDKLIFKYCRFGKSCSTIKILNEAHCYNAIYTIIGLPVLSRSLQLPYPIS